jgi:hypothetical protein
MPRKFGFHKRRAHFSSLVMTGQMSREAALDRLSRPEMDEHFLNREFEYVANKLGISTDELQGYMDAPNKTYKDYKSQEAFYLMGAKVMKALGLELGGKR